MRSLIAAFTGLSEDWVEYTHVKKRADGFYLGSGLFFFSPEIVTYFSFIGPLNTPLLTNPRAWTSWSFCLDSGIPLTCTPPSSLLTSGIESALPVAGSSCSWESLLYTQLFPVTTGLTELVLGHKEKELMSAFHDLYHCAWFGA